MPTLERGSIATLRERWASPMPDDALDTVFDAIGLDGVDINDVFCVGMPQPEFITGSVTAKREVFDRLANNLLNLKVCRLRDLKAFPCGIPQIDDVQVQFEIGR